MFCKRLYRFFYSLVIIFCSLSMSSCIDYVQSISLEGNNYNVYYKVTLSKALFAMIGQDSDEILNSDMGSLKNSLPDSVKLKAVDTDIETGAEFSLLINPKTLDKEQKDLLPSINGNRLKIPFLLGENDSLEDFSSGFDGESGSIAIAMLSFAKCRVLVSKDIIKIIDSAYFEGKRGQNYSVPVFDYGDTWCMEIPFIILSESTKYNLEHLVLIKG